jgi:hypothetical protein
MVMLEASHSATQAASLATRKASYPCAVASARLHSAAARGSAVSRAEKIVTNLSAMTVSPGCNVARAIKVGDQGQSWKIWTVSVPPLRVK